MLSDLVSCLVDPFSPDWHRVPGFRASHKHSLASVYVVALAVASLDSKFHRWVRMLGAWQSLRLLEEVCICFAIPSDNWHVFLKSDWCSLSVPFGVVIVGLVFRGAGGRYQCRNNWVPRVPP